MPKPIFNPTSISKELASIPATDTTKWNGPVQHVREAVAGIYKATAVDLKASEVYKQRLEALAELFKTFPPQPEFVKMCLSLTRDEGKALKGSTIAKQLSEVRTLWRYDMRHSLKADADALTDSGKWDDVLKLARHALDVDQKEGQIKALRAQALLDAVTSGAPVSDDTLAKVDASIADQISAIVNKEDKRGKKAFSAFKVAKSLAGSFLNTSKKSGKAKMTVDQAQEVAKLLPDAIRTWQANMVKAKQQASIAATAASVDRDGESRDAVDKQRERIAAAASN